MLALQIAVERLQHAHDRFLDGGILVKGLAPFGQLTAERKDRRDGLVPHALATPTPQCQLQGGR
jgi:hypothetical protein